MPVLTDMDVKASAIKKGDLVFDRFPYADSSKDCEAFDIKIGSKFVTIKNANAEILSRREFGETVYISRMMLTEDEIASKAAQDEADEREYLAVSVEKWVSARLEGWKAFIAMQAEMLETYPGQHYGSAIDELMTEGARVRIAQQIMNVRNNGDSPIDWADAFDVWTDRARITLVRGVGFGSNNALSRSTNIISNLTDDVWEAEIRRLLDSAQYGYL